MRTHRVQVDGSRLFQGGPYTFPNRVVGAKPIRGVNPDWSLPVPRSPRERRLREWWLRTSPSLVLQAYLRPLGIARIRMLPERGSSDGRTTPFTKREAPAPMLEQDQQAARPAAGNP